MFFEPRHKNPLSPASVCGPAEGHGRQSHVAARPLAVRGLLRPSRRRRGRRVGRKGLKKKMQIYSFFSSQKLINKYYQYYD
jgi:hypothetical protein